MCVWVAMYILGVILCPVIMASVHCARDAYRVYFYGIFGACIVFIVHVCYLALRHHRLEASSVYKFSGHDGGAGRSADALSVVIFYFHAFLRHSVHRGRREKKVGAHVACGCGVVRLGVA